MFRIDTGLFFQYPIIPNPPTGYTLALIPIPIIPSPGPGPGPTEMMWTSPPVVHVDPSSDEFRMYEFKVTRCPVKHAHDWTVCPWAHPGERARRRDPRRVAYKAIPCEEYRAVQRCRRGDRCEYAHGIFEYWLHPARYRTLACIAGAGCTRSVCFFAHGPEELRAETRYPLRPHEEWANGAGGVSYEVSESSEGSGGGSSSGSNLVESYDGDYECEMPDLEWISDLIGQD